jgi:hypothetical protein
MPDYAQTKGQLPLREAALSLAEMGAVTMRPRLDWSDRPALAWRLVCGGTLTRLDYRLVQLHLKASEETPKCE